MQYSNEDIELWDLDQLMQRASPLAALTADFNNFKQRFVQMFGDKNATEHSDRGGSITKTKKASAS